MIVLETDRLILREIQQSDFEELLPMNSDSEIMKYVGDGSVRTPEGMIAELEMLTSFYTRNPGLGIWAIVLKSINNFIGASGLVYYDNTPEIEIGYRILKEYWNNGYATEASIGLLQYGFKTLRLKNWFPRPMLKTRHPVA